MKLISPIQKMFFWFGIQLFDSKLKQYGGFNHFIAYKIFKNKFDYIIISLDKKWEFKWLHKNDAMYYDGYHNFIKIGLLCISYGT